MRFLIFLFFGLTNCSFQPKEDLGNVVHLALNSRIKGLDPIYTDDTLSAGQSSLSFETLVQYHYLKRPYQLVASLAESLPLISKDGRTYTFILKKGTFFQNDPCFSSNAGKGRELIAEDVVYSYKRLADPKLSASGWWVLDDKIVGLNEWRQSSSQALKTDYSQSIEGLKALDRYTIQFTLIRPSSQFLNSLAMPFMGVVPREAVEFYGKDFISHPVGTGPFQLAEYNPNSKIVWVRNPTYRKDFYPSEGEPSDQSPDLKSNLLEDAGKPLPLADRLVYQIILEQQPAWLTFLAGRLDASGIPKDSFSSAINEKKELSSDLAAQGIRLIKSPALDITHTTFNFSDPLIGKNKLLRQAMSLAFDGSTFIDLFFNGRALPAQGPIPPGIEGYNPDLINPYRKFDIRKAKKLLAEAGYPEGKGLPPLEYATVTGSSARQQAEYFQKMMSGIGVQITINSYAWPQFQEVIKNKRAQLWEYAWSLDYPDAENVLQLFYSKNVSPGSNDANYVNSKYDRLYERILTLPPGKERSRIYDQMVKILIDDCPWIFGVHRMNFALVQPWLKNYKPNDFDYARNKYYRVDRTPAVLKK